MKKIKEYLQNKNPYLLASIAIVALSVGMIIAILQDAPAEGSDPDVAPIVLENSSDSQEAEQQGTEESVESGEMLDVETEDEEKEASANETMETADERTESASKSSSEQETASAPEESGEPVKEAEEEMEHQEISEPTEEVMPESSPEEKSDESPETKPDEDATEPPVTVPEEVVIPEPEETPEPEVHQHSWIFESFYQAPTCSNGGLENQICVHCGETQTTIGTPTGKHVYEVESAGDCCSEEVVICKECNHREVKDMDPKNHIDEEDGFCYGCGQDTD